MSTKDFEEPEPEFDELEASFDLNDADFGEEFEIAEKFETRYIKPPKAKKISRLIKYKYAEDLANEVDLDARTFVVVNGTFIFGDFIEALVFKRNLRIKEITISSLSVSVNNIDSLVNIMPFCDKINLIVSDYFYSSERRNTIEYCYQELDKDNKFQLAAATSHCKICIFETYCGKFVVIHGSANMRSSHSIEQFVIENDRELYNFNKEYQDSILDKFKTIDKKYIGKKEIWNTINK